MKTCYSIYELPSLEDVELEKLGKCKTYVGKMGLTSSDGIEATKKEYYENVLDMSGRLAVVEEKTTGNFRYDMQVVTVFTIVEMYETFEEFKKHMEEK